MNIATILYSGLSGTASVAFSMIEADNTGNRHFIIFAGIEDVFQDYMSKCEALGIAYFTVKKKPGIDIGSQKEIIKYLKKIKPDAVVLHTLSPLPTVFYYSLGHKISIISVEHQANAMKSRSFWLASYLAMLMSKYVVCLTPVYKEQLKEKLGMFYRESKVRIISNGLDMALFSPEEKPDGGVFTLGMLSRLVDLKDHITLIEAFSILREKNGGKRNLRLMIAGDGPTMKSLKAKVKECGVAANVVFCGLISEQQSAVFLNELDLYVHASFGETMSTALMQAMACKKPVIASDVAGINNMIVNRQTGLLVPVKQPQLLADALEHLIEDEVLSRKLSENAYDYALKNFSSELMFEKYAVLF